MNTWLADNTVAHLRDVAERPDLGPRYEVTGRLGRGGMGAVYLAHDRALDREVAVKVVDHAGATADTSRRLLQEAQILARLEHPGIVPVHDAGTLADGRVFYVMKRVRGARLSDMMPEDAVPDTAAAWRTSEVSFGERLTLFLRVCDAVSFAHAHGIVHLDLKPENIMVGAFGEVLVMDWGVAQIIAAGTGTEPTVAGTPGFMAPELVAAAGAPLDGRADVFALGVILDGLLEKPRPRSLTAILARARAARREDRYETVAALARDLVRFRDGDRVEAYQETIVDRLARFYRRYRLAILLVAAYMIVRVLLLLWPGV